MTAPAPASRVAARPWTFTLMCLTALGGAAIVWIVASRAIARRDDARRHEAIRAELMRLDQVQSEWYAANGRFAKAIGNTADDSTARFVPSPGLQLLFVALSDQAWNATSTDSALVTAPRSCGIFRGPPEASPHRAALRAGSVACW